MSLLRTLLIASSAVGLLVPAATAADEPAAARAIGYAALLPGGTQGAAGATATGPTERAASVSDLHPAGGGTIGGITVDLGATTAGVDGEAEGTIVIRDVRLLDGRVVIESLRMSARTDSADPVQGGLTEGIVTGLVVDGTSVEVQPGARVEVAGIGTLIFLEHVADDPGTVLANAVRLEVTDPQAAIVIGEPFVLGHLDLTASAGVAPPAADPVAPPQPVTSAPRAPEAATAPGGGPKAPREPPKAPERVPPAVSPLPIVPIDPIVPSDPLGLPRRAAPEVTIADSDGYVFPVVGEVSFGNDYGAPRAVTGWHHGTDLFAPTGTPLLAVADGTLSRVGVNTLGGNRLWLTDDAGNTFYYAHLSAYAPAAVEGARVTAGQVIGFVGNTGQAITTPPHLHFEVHPGDGDSVNPYPYLIAWQRGTDIPRAFIQATTSASPAPAVGAVLVDGVPEIDAPPPSDDGLATPST